MGQLDAHLGRGLHALCASTRGRLAVSARFEASAEGPAPFAFGLHTYLSARGAAADASELTLPVTEHTPILGAAGYHALANQIPTLARRYNRSGRAGAR